MRLTVGSLPAAVYWRRRAIVLATGLLAVFLVAQACMAAASGGDTAGEHSPGPTPTSTSGATSTATNDSLLPDLDLPEGDGQSASPDAGASSDGEPATDDGEPAAGGAECTDDEMLITAEASETEFSAGDPVELRIVIRNDSDRQCLRDIGGNERDLYLVQGTGASRVWSSQDCGGPSGSDPQELEPGFETMHYLVWDGRSSSSCDGDSPDGGQVEAGEYQLFAMLGSARSEPVQLTIG